MSLEADMVTYILTVSELTALVGTRVHYQKLPNNPIMPAIVYNRISSPRMRSQSGDVNLTTPRIQYSCWGSTPDSVMGLADAFETAFKSFSGTAGSSTVYACIVENRLSIIDPESKFYHVPIDLRITYNG